MSLAPSPRPADGPSAWAIGVLALQRHRLLAAGTFALLALSLNLTCL